MTRAVELRSNSTDAEHRLWSRLRASQLGVRFRRQHAIAGYYVDFVCIERSLVVELDGGQHADQTSYDANRTRDLEMLGFRVLRFWNNEALTRTDDVVAEITSRLAETLPPHPNPLPRRRRGRGSRENLGADVIDDRECVEKRDNPLPQAPLGGEGWVRGQAPGSSSKADAGEGSRKHKALVVRANLYSLIRAYFRDRGVLEVETPILSRAANTDPNIESFSTQFTGHRDAGDAQRWLRTSPEYPLKRLLAEGVGDCYELGRVFRNGEAGRRHNPEFTMLEWYRVGWDHRRLMDEAADIVRSALASVARPVTIRATSYRELFLTGIGIDPLTASDATLFAELDGITIDRTGLSRDDALDVLLTQRLQPHFAEDQLLQLYDYPASQCALARIRVGDAPVAERFELYLGPVELANGYHELADAREQRARFENDNRRREARGHPALPIDQCLLAALERGLPDCAGVALGVERLLMCMLGVDAIAEVLAYPFADA